MAYNKAREERKWKQWKEKEEKQMREHGMSEDVIQKLRNSDWEDFKAERLYQKRRVDYSEYSQQESTEYEGKNSLTSTLTNHQHCTSQMPACNVPLPL